MLTRAEGKRQTKALDRERAIAFRQAARAKVKELAQAVRRARAQKKEQGRAMRARCATHRRLLKKRIKERRQRLRAELVETARLEREAARQRCSQGRARHRESALSEVAKARHALNEERVYQADLKRIEANNRAGLRGLVKANRAEKKSESDGEVLTNIPPEFAPLWAKVARSIKGSSRQSRTEAFLSYVTEHPHEVIEAQEGGIDAQIRKLEEQQARAHKLAKAPLRRRYSAAELAAVPF